MTGPVLVVGEALIDLVRRRDAGAAEHPGGSPANVALTLGRLGWDARLATWIGADARGAAIRSWLAESGVRLVPGSDGAARTPVATATLDAAGAAAYEFDLEWRLPADVPVDGVVAVHTGSIAAVLEPGGPAVVELVRRARPHATVTYDPNLRPALMGEPAAVRDRVEACVALADVVKVSDEDLGWLFPGADPMAVARRWLAAGPSVVVVTFGGDGAAGVAASGPVRVTAPPVAVVDTVGAGDSFMGALIHGLGRAGLLGAGRRDRLRGIDGATLTSLLQLGVDVAAVTVARPGADPPRLAELPPSPSVP
ncbi:PfkB family carbohydrate kinase [Jiangella anatolica]|uniref:Carbohydrate kinase n=1 Tax=Jiangella anatolica TaxID=2670374 RepID=A0A2W2D191_9ACTN|nr:PfkB family carbohydrate kinase [Jiangella anatolica]PZF86293.1 carbohydrate kinase [Jiangella anatolica]